MSEPITVERNPGYRKSLEYYEEPRTFGEMISRMREKRELTLRRMAEEIGVSAPYLSDIEHGRRNPPEDRLDLIAEKLGLTPSEKEQMFDLAAKDTSSVSLDLQDYIMNSEQSVPLRAVLRRARDINFKDWSRILDEIETKEE